MAQTDGSSNTALRPYRNPYGSIRIEYYEESTCASSKTIREGDIVTFDTNVSTNKVRLVVAPSSQGAAASILEAGGGSLIGVAVTASTSDGSTAGMAASTAPVREGRKIGVAVNDGLNEFAISISSVGGQPLQPASSMLGKQYAVIRSSNATVLPNRGGHGMWFLDSTNSTAADQTFVVTHIPSDQIGTTGGFVVGKFLSTMTHRSVRLGGPVT